MYGAYYPYLYGRGAARSFHHAPHFQYDRLNVQSSGHGAAGGSEAFGGSCGSSSGAGSPVGRAKQEGRASASSDEEEAGGRRAHYVSANCVVFTHYAGDVAAVVDEHFSRALALDKHKESVPMVSRNLPASFFNALAGGSGGGAPACQVDLYEYDPWHQHYSGYAGGPYAHHNMAAGYGGLLLGRGALHAPYKPVEWGAQHHAPHHLDAHHYYPPVTGLEAQVQDSSKDLYWF